MPDDQPPLDPRLAETRAWVRRAVIGLNLCPFARGVEVKEQIRYVLTEATDTDALLEVLVQELQTLAAADPAEIETTVLVHPEVLADFLDFNDFLDVADAAVRGLGLAGTLQIASFHPQFQFADAPPDDITHATNRSPYPTLHLIREASIDRAVAAFPEAEAIYEVNMETMRRLGPEGWARLRQACRDDAAAEDAAAEDAPQSRGSRGAESP